METAIAFVRRWIAVTKSRHTVDDSPNYGPIDKEFSEAILAIMLEDITREEAVEQLDTLFASRFEYKHPRWVDLYLDVRNMVQPEKAEVTEEDKEWELIGTSQ